MINITIAEATQKKQIKENNLSYSLTPQVQFYIFSFKSIDSHTRTYVSIKLPIVGR